MPLPTPYAYIVCCDLNQPAQKYEGFFNELKQSDFWWHYLSGTWIVKRRETLVEMSNKLRPLIFSSDRLLILPAKGPADGWLPQDAWIWINENLPKEW